MRAGCSSLLRPSPAPLVRAALLAISASALGVPAALAASPAPAPDPSPRVGLVEPDPYPAASAPARRTGTPRITTIPVTVVRLPVRKPPVVAPAKKTPKASRIVKRKAVAHATAQTARPIRIPDHPAPQLVALGQTAVDPPRRVSRALVAALGLLVLASTALVAGAARELAR